MHNDNDQGYKNRTTSYVNSARIVLNPNKSRAPRRVSQFGVKIRLKNAMGRICSVLSTLHPGENASANWQTDASRGVEAFIMESRAASTVDVFTRCEIKAWCTHTLCAVTSIRTAAAAFIMADFLINFLSRPPLNNATINRVLFFLAIKNGLR